MDFGHANCLVTGDRLGRGGSHFLAFSDGEDGNIFCDPSTTAETELCAEVEAGEGLGGWHQASLEFKHWIGFGVDYLDYWGFVALDGSVECRLVDFALRVFVGVCVFCWCE